MYSMTAYLRLYFVNYMLYQSTPFRRIFHQKVITKNVPIYAYIVPDLYCQVRICVLCCCLMVFVCVVFLLKLFLIYTDVTERVAVFDKFMIHRY
jgi:hypothetical protein